MATFSDFLEPRRNLFFSNDYAGSLIGSAEVFFREAQRESIYDCIGQAVPFANRAKPRRQEEELEVGTLLLYRNSSSTGASYVTLVKVHHDDDPPYYTIRMPDGREKQTIRANLATCQQDSFRPSSTTRETCPQSEENTSDSRPARGSVAAAKHSRKDLRTPAQGVTRKRKRLLDYGTRAPSHSHPHHNRRAPGKAIAASSGSSCWWSLAEPFGEEPESEPPSPIAEERRVQPQKRTDARISSIEERCDDTDRSKPSASSLLSVKAASETALCLDSVAAKDLGKSELECGTPLDNSNVEQKREEEPSSIWAEKGILGQQDEDHSVLQSGIVTAEPSAKLHSTSMDIQRKRHGNGEQDSRQQRTSGRATTIIGRLFDRGLSVVRARQLLRTAAPREELSREELARLHVVAQVESKFIVTRLGCELIVLIDQHAASERIELEKFQHAVLDGSGDGCALEASPVQSGNATIQVTLEEARWLRWHRSKCERWGFRYQLDEAAIGSEAGAGSPALIACSPVVVVTHVPDILGTCLSPCDLKSLVAEVEAGCKGPPKVVLHILAFKACRRAVKFGDPLSRIDMERMLACLSKCYFPFQCAHGRPTVYPLLNVQAFQTAVVALTPNIGAAKVGRFSKTPPLARILAPQHAN